MLKVVAVFCVSLALISGALAQQQLVYKVGQESHFTLSSNVDTRGQLSSGSRTSGSYSTFTGVVAIKCTQIDKNGQYIFAMNIFDAQVGVGQGPAQLNNVEHVSLNPYKGSVRESSKPLGYDMYFAQLPSGQITQVWYNTDDSPYFVHVKSSVINAFQTRVVARDAKATFEETDLVGDHTTAFVGGAKATSLLINKQFSQTDFKSFADPSVTSRTVSYSGQASHIIHPEGFFQGATTESYVVLSDISGASKTQKKKQNRFGDSTDMSGFDMTMSSKGSMMLSLMPTSPSRFGEVSALVAAIEDYTESSLKVLGANGAAFSSARAGIRDFESQDVHETIATASQIENAPENLAEASKALRRASKWITVNGINENVKYFLEQSLMNAKSIHGAQAILFLLTNVHGDAAVIADSIFVAHALRNNQWKSSAVVAVSTSPQTRIISKPLIDELVAIIKTDTNMHEDVTRQAVLALGVALGRTQSHAEAVATLHSLFATAEETSDLVLVMNAIANADAQASHVISIRDLATKRLLEHENDGVRVAVLHLAEKFPVEQSLLVISHFASVDDSPKIRRLALKMFAKHVEELSDPEAVAAELAALATEDSQFPFNRSYTGSSTFGGDWLGVTFAADFFVGTNFNCKQPNFNYKVFGDVSATINLLKYQQSALEGQIIYGKADGSVIGSDMWLKVWGKTVYEKQLPTVDCSEHVFPLYHTAPGFDKTYTVWVSIVPVTFTVGVDVVVDVQWGWSICDAQLSAQVELIPSATLVASASAETDLLIIYAGATLDASFNAVVRPQAYIHGSECNAGVQATLQTQPMNAELKGYYKKQVCKLWIFDCHWGTTETKQFWSWSLPAQTKTLFNEQLNIGH